MLVGHRCCASLAGWALAAVLATLLVFRDHELGGAPSKAEAAPAKDVAPKEGLVQQVAALTKKVEALEKQPRLKVGGTATAGYIVVGDKMIQWGVGKTRPPNYDTQLFAPAFAAAPTVTSSIDGRDQNDAYCNIAHVKATHFAFVAVSQPGTGPKGKDSIYDIPARTFHWVAIGKAKKGAQK